jgi:predicted aspartyl protease
LPLTTEADGRVSVPITVQDKTYSFLVDTGGAMATIGWDQAEELGLSKRTGSIGLAGVDGRYTNSYITADHISLGKMTGNDLIFYVEQLGGAGFDGTLAPDMLKHFDIDFDFAHGKMNLFSQDHCPGKVVYWTQGDYVSIPMQVDGGSHIRVPVTVDGKSIMAIVDTGAVTSVMSMHAAGSLGIDEDTPGLKLKTSAGFGKKSRIYSYPFKTLEMGGVVVKNPHITIGSNEYMGRFRSDMILGVGILRQLHLYIAYKEEKFYITPAGAN